MYPILPGITQSDNRTTDSTTTNRWISTPHLDNPIVGVDTIRVRGLHNGHDLRHKTERTLVDPTTGEIRVVGSKSYDFVWVNGHKVALQADNRQGGGVSFEFSVPKVLRRTNEVAASILEVAELVQQVHHAASYLVDWTADCTALELHRVDLVRCFENVTDISTTLNRLSVVQQTREDSARSSPTRNGVSRRP